MKAVLFVMMPSMGHITATLNLAQTFKKKGYIIYYTAGVSQYLDLYIKEQGFNAIPFQSVPFGLNYFDELDYYKRLDETKSDLIQNRFSDLLYLNRRKSYEILLNTISFKYIFLDSFLGADFLCLYPLLKNTSVKFSFLNTMAAIVHNDKTLKISKKSIFTKVYNHFHKLKTDLTFLYERVFMFGKDSQTLIKKKASILEIPSNMNLISNGRISTTFNGIKEFVLSTKELGNHTSNINRVYLGLQVLDKRSDIITILDRERLLKIFEKNKKIIYVSLGTETTNNKKANYVLGLILSVAKFFFEFDFIVSNVKDPEFVKKNKCQDNVHIFSMVPQTYVLSKTALFITHGGLNSIKEAVFYSVPLLVIPIKPTYDQPINARRIEECKIGLAMNPDTINRKQISKKIQFILRNKSFKENLVKMIARTRSEESTESMLLEKINQL